MAGKSANDGRNKKADYRSAKVPQAASKAMDWK
jgi:hypothetical protein